MTTELEQIRAARAELAALRAERDAWLASMAAAPAAPVSDAVARTGLSPEQLAVESLVRHSGWTREAACDEVLAKGAAAFSAEVAYEAHVINERLASEAKAEWDATPDGLRHQAEVLRFEDERHERDVEAASRLLLDQGLTEDDLGLLDDWEILEGAGIEQPACLSDEADSWEANVAAANAITTRATGENTSEELL